MTPGSRSTTALRTIESRVSHGGTTAYFGAAIRARRLLRGLRGRSGPGTAGDRILEALTRPQRWADDAGCRPTIERIEQVRRDLLASTATLEVVDYGAGPADSTRSAAEAAAGVVVERRLADICRNASSDPAKALRLFALVRALRPQRVIELGTNLGIAASYMAGALSIDGDGTLVTLEGSPPTAEVARRTLAQLDLEGRATLVLGRFADTLPTVVEQHGPFDLAFIDGHHDGRATIAYVDLLAAHASPGAVLVLDDIRWSPSMRDAWRIVAADDRVAEVIDHGSMGYLVLR